MSFTNLPVVVNEVADLGRAFRAAGFRLYLVGGVVRDLWLDTPLDNIDIDLTTDATPADTKRIVADLADAVWTQGERFGTIGCRINDREIEITTHREEVYEASSRKPFVQFSTAISADLSRRDFTVNAMAVELPDGELVDPFDGVGDLAEGVLRTPIGAMQSFSDDPLRMLRAARFITRYHMSPTDELVVAMTDLAPRISIVAVERVRDELDKLLATADPGPGFHLLASSGVLAQMMPGVSKVLVSGETAPLKVLKGTDSNDPIGRVAALAWFDLVGDHMEPTVEGGQTWARQRRYSADEGKQIGRIIGGTATLGKAVGDDPNLRRWAAGIGRDRNRSMVLAELLNEAHPNAELRKVIDQVRAGLHRLAQTEDLDDYSMPFGGERVMTILGIESGRVVGEVLEAFREYRFDHGPLTEAEALAIVATFRDPQQNLTTES